MGWGLGGYVRCAPLGLAAGLALVVAPAGPAGAAVGCTAVMGRATSTPAQMAGWFASTGHRPRLDVGVLDLATMFVEEGAREGVRGDIAFAQSIVETGYFGFSASVPPETHNYSGIGATGGGVRGAPFPDARTGVRAQVQHLRAYADPTVRSARDLHAPLVDPRFGYVVPNARTAPCWEHFGSGVWAEDPTGYGAKVLAVNQRIAAFPRPAPAAPAAPAPAALSAPAVAEPLAAHPVGPEVGAAAPPTLDGGLLTAGPDTAAPVMLASPAAAAGPGDGAVAAAAKSFTGLALLSICVTVWWHGRRFSRD